MQVTIQKSEISGTAVAPSSKSYTIRGLMCAALAGGRSEIIRPLNSEDTLAARRVLEQVGVGIAEAGDRWRIERADFRAPAEEMHCGDSAATLRFMSALCALVPGTCCLRAGSSLSGRPIKILVEALKGWGVDISLENDGSKVIVRGGRLQGGLTMLPGDVSSQYVSALLLIAPLAEKTAVIKLTTPLESRPYVAMTVEALRQFGIEIDSSPDLMSYEASRQDYRPAGYRVEGDWSSASYLLGLGALGGDIKVRNLNPRSLQGDRRIGALLLEMGAAVEEGGDSLRVKRGNLRAIAADLNDCIDLLPTLSVLAALAEGTSVFSGIGRARLKESDRVRAIREGLARAGIKVEEEPDRLAITGGKLQRAVIDSHNDHRIAMAFSLLGVAGGGITINGAECIAKTYPEYWDVLHKLGVEIDEQ